MSNRPSSSAAIDAPMDRVIFGDNQFFGVNHMSEEKARAQSMRFQDLHAVIDVLDAAYQEGIRTFMCTTHDRMGEICDHFRAHPDKYPGYRFYPCMPYAHKYANAVTENGMIEALRMFLPQDGAVGAMLKGGVAAYEQAIAQRRFRPVAMSVLASGAISPREAIEYVCAQPRIESIVFGASGRSNIRQTKALIDELTVVAA